MMVDQPTDQAPGGEISKKDRKETAPRRSARSDQATHDERLLENPRPEHVEFTKTDPWRVLRIQGEFVEGFDALADLGPAVTFFGSARTKENDPMYQAAVETARLLAQEGLAIITGGGPGIMEAVNRGAREAGGLSVGLNIELPFEQKINEYVSLGMTFRYFFVRKVMFVKYAQAFVIFPGGFGTLDELFESLTLIQTGKIYNFPVILYGSQYWSGLLSWLKATVLTGKKIAAADLDLMVVADSPEQVRRLVTDAMVKAGWLQQKEAAAREETRKAYQKNQ